jgi:hypothetical protein
MVLGGLEHRRQQIDTYEGPHAVMHYNQFAITWDCLQTTSHTLLTFRTTVHHSKQLTTRIGAEYALLQGLALPRGHNQYHPVNIRAPIKHPKCVGENRNTLQVQELLFNSSTHAPSLTSGWNYGNNTHKKYMLGMNAVGYSKKITPTGRGFALPQKRVVMFAQVASGVMERWSNGVMQK